MTTRSIALAVTVLVVFVVAVFAAPTRAVADPHGDPQTCFAADNTHDGRIDVLDMQRASAHYGAPEYGPYDPQFDIEPLFAPDGDIDIKDLQKVFGRNAGICSVVKQGTNEMYHAGGQYYGSVTVWGYEWSYFGPGYFSTRVLDLNAGQTQGVELCVGTKTQTDWNYFGQLGPSQSPYTITGEGGYADGLLACFFGQQLWVYNWYWWENAQFPMIPFETEPPPYKVIGYTHCFERIPLPEGGDPLGICSWFPE